MGCPARINYLPAALASLGWEVTGIDIRPFELDYSNFPFVLGDMTNTDFPDGHFNAAYTLSSLEHFGLGGRYGVREDDSKGDSKAVKEIWRVVRPGGPFTARCSAVRVDPPTRKRTPAPAGAGRSTHVTGSPEWIPVPSKVRSSPMVCWRGIGVTSIPNGTIRRGPTDVEHIPGYRPEGGFH